MRLLGRLGIRDKGKKKVKTCHAARWTTTWTAVRVAIRVIQIGNDTASAVTRPFRITGNLAHDASLHHLLR